MSGIFEDRARPYGFRCYDVRLHPPGNMTEVDISIDPAEPLPANGTVTISTEGVYVIISSDTVTVTNQTVDIGTAEEEEDGTEFGGGTDGETESVGGFNEGTGTGGGSDDEAEGNDDGTEFGGGSDEVEEDG